MIIAGLCLLTMGWLAPNYIPSFFGTVADIVGAMGRTFPGFMENLVLCIYAVHLSQAAQCLYVCHTLGLDTSTSLSWFVQTLGFGMFALRFLIWPRNIHGNSQKTITQEKRDIDAQLNCYICGAISHTMDNCISYKWCEEMRTVLKYRGRCDQCLIHI